MLIKWFYAVSQQNYWCIRPGNVMSDKEKKKNKRKPEIKEKILNENTTSNHIKFIKWNLETKKQQIKLK